LKNGNTGASGADNDWGPWCIETGWNSDVDYLDAAMRQMKYLFGTQSLKAISGRNFEKLQPMMMPLMK